MARPEAARPAPADRTRVVHLVLSLGVGGLEMMVLHLARHADRARFDTRVLCLREPGPLAAAAAAAGVEVDSLDCPGLPKARTLARLARKLRALRPHVLHTHNPSPHLFGALAAPAAGVPVVVHTKHGRNYPDSPRAVWVNRVASWLTDRVVAVSEATAAVASGRERVPGRKVCVIPNGIDVARFRPPAVRPADPLRVIHVARLNRIKDQPTLLRAARLVADAEPGFRLDVVGDGPERAGLEALAAALWLGPHVRFLGERHDVNDLLATAALFVLSSVSEGIPVTLLEAMAAGLPAAVTDVGGNREVVVPGETGVLVPPGDPEALGRAILAALRDPAGRARMGAAARRVIEDRFDVRHTAARYHATYLELLGGRAPRRRPYPVFPNAPEAQCDPARC